MSTAIEDKPSDQPADAPLVDGDPVALLRCKRCNLQYTPSKSSSELKLTYCSFLCELGDLGFSISGLEHMELKPAESSPDPA